jgi:hypothetical protein
LYYFTYITRHENGKFYVGRHSSKRINDNYFGSGRWVGSIEDKSKLTREVLEFFDDMTSLREAERILISQHIGKENCMNFNQNPVGFASGELNPNSNLTPERRKLLSERMLGEKNPAKRQEVRAKMSESQRKKPRGKWKKPMSEQGRKNISDARNGYRAPKEVREAHSQMLKEAYASGERVPARAMLGKNHSEETKEKLRKPKEIVKCPRCGKNGGISAMYRWHFDRCKVVPKDIKE